MTEFNQEPEGTEKDLTVEQALEALEKGGKKRKREEIRVYSDFFGGYLRFRELSPLQVIEVQRWVKENIMTPELEAENAEAKEEAERAKLAYERAMINYSARKRVAEEAGEVWSEPEPEAPEVSHEIDEEALMNNMEAFIKLTAYAIVQTSVAPNFNMTHYEMLQQLDEIELENIFSKIGRLVGFNIDEAEREDTFQAQPSTPSDVSPRSEDG